MGELSASHKAGKAGGEPLGKARAPCVLGIRAGTVPPFQQLHCSPNPQAPQSVTPYGDRVPADVMQMKSC